MAFFSHLSSAVEKDLRECIQKGPLAGYPVYSSVMSFKMAATEDYKNGMATG